MVQHVSTVAFEGIEARAVDVQVQVAPGLPAFAIVGLPDKAVSEARERVRSALIASGLALPARRITINLAPADLLRVARTLARRRGQARGLSIGATGLTSSIAIMCAFRRSAAHHDPLPWTEPRMPIADKNSCCVSA